MCHMNGPRVGDETQVGYRSLDIEALRALLTGPVRASALARGCLKLLYTTSGRQAVATVQLREGYENAAWSWDDSACCQRA